MSRFIQMVVLASLAALVTVSAPADERSEYVKSPVEIDGTFAEALMIATRDFAKAHRNFACFVVELSEEDSAIHVAFIPKQSAEGEMLLGGRTRCGAGVSYKVENGRIVKKWFAR